MRRPCNSLGAVSGVITKGEITVNLLIPVRSHDLPISPPTNGLSNRFTCTSVVSVSRFID